MTLSNQSLTHSLTHLKTASHKRGVRQGSLVFCWLCEMRVHKPHKNFDQWVSESDRLLNVTCNDISVIYVTAHICASRLKKIWDLRSGSNRHRHVVVFFNVSVQAPTQGQPFYGYSEKSPHFSRILRRAWGYGGPIVVLHPRIPTEELASSVWRKNGARTISFITEFGFVLFWGFRSRCFVSLLWQWISPRPKFKRKLTRLCM